MQRSISDALSFYNQFVKDQVIIEKLWSVIDNTPKIKWYDKWKKFKHKTWKIEIKKLNYWYTKDKPVFKDFDLKLEWEKVTALVWNGGSWKTTLIKLIAWYIREDSWDIIIDNQKLNEVSLKSYYKDIWYLTQEPSVFDWSVFENLTYAIPQSWILSPNGRKGLQQKQNINSFSLGGKDAWKADRGTELDKIIKLSKCEFIYDLPDGINTEIWEKWIRLSWWQRQRLAIAKIFLKDPKIILLDEPTSALDSFSEELITKALHNLFKWRTIIIIAHRLQTVKNADDIILFANWKIKERWTHSELVKKNWVYKKMLDLQSGF